MFKKRTSKNRTFNSLVFSQALTQARHSLDDNVPNFLKTNCFIMLNKYKALKTKSKGDYHKYSPKTERSNFGAFIGC